MREKKFTPGPWKFSDGWKLYRTDGDKFCLEVGKNAGTMLCKYDEEWLANALVAEAAPDLLEALEGMMAQFLEEVADAEYTSAYCEAVSVVQKAYGETP